MKLRFKQFVKTFFGVIGYEIRKKDRSSVLARCIPSNPFETQYYLMNEIGKSDVTILDVGANKGQTTEAYRVQFPNADIYCFEPFPDSVAALQREFSNDGKIHIVPKAVAERNGRRIFYVNERDATNSLLPRPTSGRRYYPKAAGYKETIEVDVINLDEFVIDNKIPKVDILKLDIQGGELMALRGAKALLQTGDIAIIYTEIMFIPHYEGDPLFHKIWSFLTDFGYSLFEIYDICRAKNGQIRYGNALFVDESLRKNVINKFPEEP